MNDLFISFKRFILYIIQIIGLHRIQKVSFQCFDFGYHSTDVNEWWRMLMFNILALINNYNFNTSKDLKRSYMVEENTQFIVYDYRRPKLNPTYIPCSLWIYFVYDEAQNAILHWNYPHNLTAALVVICTTTIFIEIKKKNKYSVLNVGNRR